MANHFNDSGYAPYQRPAEANRHLQEALAKRQRYLDRHPHLQDYQAEIDRVLDQSGNSYGRMAVLGTLIQGKLLEMQKELYKLTENIR